MCYWRKTECFCLKSIKRIWGQTNYLSIQTDVNKRLLHSLYGLLIFSSITGCRPRHRKRGKRWGGRDRKVLLPNPETAASVLERRQSNNKSYHKACGDNTRENKYLHARNRTKTMKRHFILDSNGNFFSYHNKVLCFFAVSDQGSKPTSQMWWENPIDLLCC